MSLDNGVQATLGWDGDMQMDTQTDVGDPQEGQSLLTQDQGGAGALDATIRVSPGVISPWTDGWDALAHRLRLQGGEAGRAEREGAAEERGGSGREGD